MPNLSTKKDFSKKDLLPKALKSVFKKQNVLSNPHRVSRNLWMAPESEKENSDKN